MKKTDLFAIALLAAFAAGCSGKPADAPPAAKFTDQQLAAQMPEDLGPDRIDVSKYPAEHRAAYALLEERCTKCHTLARVINSDFVDAGTWNRFLHRMHGKFENRFDAKLLSADEARRLVGLLEYDARERKVKGRKAFYEQKDRLNALYAEVSAERERLQREQGAEQARESAPYVGDKR